MQQPFGSGSKANLASYAGLRLSTPTLLAGAAVLFILSAPYLAWRWLRWTNELIPLREAGQWVYEEGGAKAREACLSFRGQFTILGYGEMRVKYYAEKHRLTLLGRREPNLAIEPLYLGGVGTYWICATARTN